MKLIQTFPAIQYITQVNGQRVGVVDMEEVLGDLGGGGILKAQ